MDAQTKKLHEQAMNARAKYNAGMMSREEVEKLVVPYIKLVNERAKINAKRYGVPFRQVSVSGFLR